MFVEVAEYEIFGRDLSECIDSGSGVGDGNGASASGITFTSFIAPPRAVTPRTRAVRGNGAMPTRTLGIVGMGSIGRTIAARAGRLPGSRVLYSGATALPELEASSGATWLPVEDLVRQADVVCVVLPPADRMGLGPRHIESLAPRQLFIARRRCASIERSVDFLSTRYAEHLHVADLARVAGLSESYFQHQFTAITGMSPHRYQLLLRVFHAMAHLRGGMAIRDAAQVSGFADQSHLHRFFRRIVGVPPGQYQRRFNAG